MLHDHAVALFCSHSGALGAGEDAPADVAVVEAAARLAGEDVIVVAGEGRLSATAVLRYTGPVSPFAGTNDDSI